MVITSKPRVRTQDFHVEVWSNSHSASDIVTSQHPLALFARITKGSSPVLDARVSIEVYVSTPNGTSDLQTLGLFDNGNGGNKKCTFNCYDLVIAFSGEELMQISYLWPLREMKISHVKVTTLHS